MEIRWAPVWTDEKLIKLVLMQTSNFFKKIKEKGKLKLSFPYFEYEYQPTQQDLYFQKEVNLAEHLETKSIKEILDQINIARPFKPFITQIEETLIFPLDLPEYFRFILSYLLKIPEVPEVQKREIRVLTSLPREVLQEKILKSGATQSPFPFALADKYVKPILPLYPELGKTITELAIKEKLAIKNSFRGEDYFVYFVSLENKPSDFAVYFPTSAAQSLPNSGEFKARIIGIVSYTANLPLGIKKGMPFFIRAVSLFLPYMTGQSN
jgi:hypothetical protein